MSRIKSSPGVTYRCANDCKQEGCPGHTLFLDLNTYGNNYVVRIDDKDWQVFDQNMFDAMALAYNQLR